MDVQEIAAREYEILVIFDHMAAPMVELARQLREAGIFEQYRQIHKDYAELALQGNIEALKRALFIQWYGATEPSCFTGIPSQGPWGDDIGLDEEIEKLVLALVEKYALSADMDEEFGWMLAHYYYITDYYFEYFWNTSELVRRLREQPQEPETWQTIHPSRESLSNRGQMGDYWLLKTDDEYGGSGIKGYLSLRIQEEYGLNKIKGNLWARGVHLILERPVKDLSLAEMARRLEQAGRQYEQELASSSGTAEHCAALSHVIGIERWGQRRLRVALGDPPIQDEYDAYRPPRERAWQELVADFKATRQETLKLVNEIERCGLPEGWKIRHNMFGDLSVRGWLRYLEMHSDPRGGHRIK